MSVRPDRDDGRTFNEEAGFLGASLAAASAVASSGWSVGEHLALGAEARRIRHRDEVGVDR